MSFGICNEHSPERTIGFRAFALPVLPRASPSDGTSGDSYPKYDAARHELLSRHGAFQVKTTRRAFLQTSALASLGAAQHIAPAQQVPPSMAEEPARFRPKGASLNAFAIAKQHTMRRDIPGPTLAAEKGNDISDVHKAFITMERSAQKNDVAALLDANLAFHLGLCRFSDNLYLIDHANRLLTPFFAFVRIHAIASGQSASLWAKDFPAFRRIVELIEESEGETVEQYIRRVMVGLQPQPMLVGK